MRRSGLLLIEVAILLGLGLHLWVMVGHAAPPRTELLRDAMEQLRENKLGRYYDDEYQPIFEWAAHHLPPDAVVLYLTPIERDWWLYFRGSYTLYPRKVWMASPRPRPAQTDWWMHVPLDPEGFGRLASQYRFDYLLVRQIPPDQVPLLDPETILWYSRDPAWYLAKVAEGSR